MKITLSAVSGVLAMSMSMSFSAFADNHAQPDIDPVEIYTCSFNEGKGMADLDELDARFKSWADKNNKDHSSWRLVPVLRATGEPFEVGYIGAWNSGETMGAGMDAWNANGDLLAEYEATITCDHSLLASVEVHAPNGPPENGVVWFSSCKVSKHASEQLAFEAHSKLAAEMRDMGGKGQSWLFYPSLGLGEVPFDYYSVVSFNSMAELGMAWEGYYNKGGWQKASALAAVTHCDSPRVYQATAIRIGPQD